MSCKKSAALCLSVITLAISSTLPVFAKNNPMMMTVVEGNTTESETAASAVDMLHRVPGA